MWVAILLMVLTMTAATDAFLVTTTAGPTEATFNTIRKQDGGGGSSRIVVASPPKQLFLALSERELEIRRKIKQLKKSGRIQKKQDRDEVFDEVDRDDDDDEYVEKIRQKLGTAKSKLLGFEGGSEGAESMDDEKAKTSSSSTVQQPRSIGLGAMKVEEEAGTLSSEDDDKYKRRVGDDDGPDVMIGSMDDEDDEDDDDDLEEEDLVELVARRMQEKRDREQREKEARMKQEARERLDQLEQERQLQQENQQDQQQTQQTSSSSKTTSGVGGSWDKTKKPDAEQDMYKPKTGSWGAFPRPRDISKAYGGGRRVGPGYSNEKARKQSEDETRQRLQKYRVKAGIDVESEKEHKDDIDQALQIATYAMQRGVYSTAVSALEKVTPYCSSNSKVGGKVFLELAMAYEAVGRSKEAITVYSTLTKSTIGEIKSNAKRLLYGLEAMQFMQENVSSSDFSRKRAKRTFIDTTGFGDIASKFDDVYETAYIDMSKGFYKKLTEAVVRSSREARQILLLATGPGEVERLRIVQALRSLSRNFEEALQKEIKEAKPAKEPTAVMDGKPILQAPEKDDVSRLVSSMGTDEFVLMEPQQMVSNLNGEWRLQLIADKRGDGVKFFNTSLAWQQMDTDTMSFESFSPQGFLTVQQNGGIEFNDKRRILRRKSMAVSGGAGGMLTGLFGGTKMGAVGAIRSEQQVVIVDSSLLVTRGVPTQRKSNSDDEKDYFAVWRRVEPGTYSNSNNNPSAKAP